MLKNKRRAKRSPSVLPKLSALLTCDAVTRDPNSGKATLYGVFDKIISKAVPATAQFSVYARMGGASGHHSAVLELIDPKGKKVGPDSSAFEFDAVPDACIEMQMVAIGFEFKSFGEYRLSVKCDGNVIGSAPVYLVKAQTK